tara:strand:- start:230 stop:1978 length:1749 start_codon:yes stop_codon:yes gene_type:complete
MNKSLIIAFLVFVLSVIVVSAAASFQIVEGSVNATSGSDTTLSSLSFTVNNTGTTSLDIGYSGFTLISGTNQLSISSLSNKTGLANGSSYSPTFSVAIPKQARSGLYTGTLTATNGSLSDTITVNINVTESYSASMSPSIIKLGSSTLNTTKTSYFNITNSGNEDLTLVSFDFSDSGFNFWSNNSNFTLGFNATEEMQFNVTIPSSFSTGNVTLGSVKIVSTELNTTLSDVTASVGGGLEIEDLDVFLSTRIPNLEVFSETRESKTASDTDVSNGDKLKFAEKVGPESKLRFNFDIENTFTDSEGIDINDIIVKVTIVEIDDGDDIEEEASDFDLDSDSTEVIDVTVDIPLSVDEGVYDIVIEVIGEDDDGNEHTIEWDLSLDIDKEIRDIAVITSTLFPEKIKCSGASTLTATIKNLGSRLEDEAGLTIVNEELGLNVIEQNIELEEDPYDDDNEFTKSVVINVDKNTKAGTYPIVVKSYMLENVVWERKTVNLVVESCGGVEEDIQEEETEETETVEVTGDEQEQETVDGVKVPVLGPSSTTEVPLTKKTGFWVAVILINIVVLGGIAYFVYNIVGKKAQ